MNSTLYNFYERNCFQTKERELPSNKIYFFNQAPRPKLFPDINNLHPHQHLFNTPSGVADDPFYCTWSSSPNTSSCPNSSKPLNLNISFDISSTRLRMRWIIENEFALRRNVHYVVEINETGRETERYQKFSVSWRAFTEMNVVPGRKYDVSVQCIENAFKSVIATGFQKIKAVFSILETQRLLELAIRFVKPSLQPFYVLYRCKPKVYWDDLRYNCNGIMVPYEKDTNGQPANRINEEINGLFFNARTMTDGSLPPQSPFGNVRMQIDARSLLNPEKFNLYFADFYCNEKRIEFTKEQRPHYVTILVALINSASDEFAKRNLIALNSYENPFLKYDINRQSFVVNTSVWVEIFFTEHVPLHWGRLEKVAISGVGCSKLGGLPNNKFCDKCNLYPLLSDLDNALEQPIKNEHIEEKKPLRSPLKLNKNCNVPQKAVATVKSLISPVKTKKLTKKRKQAVERTSDEDSKVKRARILEVNSCNSPDSLIEQHVDRPLDSLQSPNKLRRPENSAISDLLLEDKHLLILLDKCNESESIGN